MLTKEFIAGLDVGDSLWYCNVGAQKRVCVPIIRVERDMHGRRVFTVANPYVVAGSVVEFTHGDDALAGYYPDEKSTPDPALYLETAETTCPCCGRPY